MQKEEPIIPLESIEIIPSKLDLLVDNEYQLTLKLLPVNATYQDVVWSSSDAKIASVNSEGLVTTYLKSGKVTIKADHKADNGRDVNISASCEVTVKAINPDNSGDSTDPNNPNNPHDPNNPNEISPETSLVEGLAFMNVGYSVGQYDTINIKQDLCIFPAEIASKVTVKFQSSDVSIATVNDKGQVVGIEKGEVIILATANGKEAKCNVYVTPFIAPQSLSLNYTEQELFTDKTLQLYASFTPNRPTYSALQWRSSNTDVASVTESGLVTTHKSGNAVITVTHKAVNMYDKEVSAACSIKVKSYNDLFEMVYVEGGTFQMGSTEEQGSDVWDNEKPVHTVSVTSFYLSKTEVTQAQYKAITGENPSYFKGDELPVERVSWNDAKAFCEKLSQLTGKQYVLPTEAQWEYAARGGKYKENTKFAGSNNVDDVAWYGDNSGTKTHPVATKAPNALGLYDMSGNVWEWCADWYGTYSTEIQVNPTGPKTGVARVFRGGIWNNAFTFYARVTYRDAKAPNFVDDCGSHGFRIALIP